ncbi:hypothetical protein BR93DRAFT_134913 [Coniochaeta sp. PMI_546]|nr:hypothetical protein BR93DRAFT_134913 [Coniochaeta sp. PMI_546]
MPRYATRCQRLLTMPLRSLLRLLIQAKLWSNNDRNHLLWPCKHSRRTVSRKVYSSRSPIYSAWRPLPSYHHHLSVLREFELITFHLYLLNPCNRAFHNGKSDRMPLRLLTLYKGYRTVSNSLSSIRKSTDAPESFGDAMLYDPPANSRQVAPAAPSSPCPSTVCLPGTPRHGPLIDFDDGCNDEPEEETDKIVHEVRGELMSDEFDETAEEIDKCGEENAAGREDDTAGGIAADGRFSPGTTLACTHVCDKDNKQLELFEFFGVDEDAVELKGELRLDEQEGIVLETIFDCNSEGGGYESNDSSNGLDDSWCTTDELQQHQRKRSRLKTQWSRRTLSTTGWVGARKRSLHSARGKLCRPMPLRPNCGDWLTRRSMCGLMLSKR